MAGDNSLNMISENLKTYLSDHGISQAFLSKKTGIENWKIQMIVNGTCKILVSDYCKICNALQIDFKGLLPETLKPENEVRENETQSS